MSLSPRNIVIFQQSTLADKYVHATENAILDILGYVPGQKRYRLLTNVAANNLADMWVALSNSRTLETARRIRFKQIETTIIARALDYMAHRTQGISVDPILLLNDGLYPPGYNYVFGFNTADQTGVVVARGDKSPAMLTDAQFTQIIRHELGHKFGATTPGIRPASEIYNYPGLGEHCLSPNCVMNVIASTDDLIKNPTTRFCPGCVAAIKRELSR